MARIRFGSSGWEGILGEDFTFENLRIITQAIADHLRAISLDDRGVVVGFDARFMGWRFAREVARVLAGCQIKAFFCDAVAPAPALALQVIRRGAACGIHVASGRHHHEFNGLKFYPAPGAGPLWEAAGEIESKANALMGEVCYREMLIDEAFQSGLVEKIDFRYEYLESLRNNLNLEALSLPGLRMAVNPFFGAACGYIEEILSGAGVQILSHHAHRDPCFGGMTPDPVEHQLQDFAALIRDEEDVCLGLATDAVGTRFGVVDGDGTFIDADAVLALLCDYLARTRGADRGCVARSVAKPALFDAVARSHGLDVVEIPDPIGGAMEILASDRLLMAGLTGGRFVAGGHLPYADGILAALLVAEMQAVEGQSPGRLLEDLRSRMGHRS